MFTTQVLRLSAARAASFQATRRAGQSFATKEIKRNAVNVLGVCGFLAAVLGWPFAIRSVYHKH
ncbi:uncharacterized protein SCDLUD_001709 [Saccharomycodes ludwigii]|uniref:uncharacterized protein n=1 Tax=Saccharomycodes ludwigii TaxID=36035 RepID=UPI001E8C7C8E|nr:hypothetical protein SCDLUD_001709 [Saccharomycodes ludwigii]KAH3901925.1 hypothetical protein SCDLUD_001709 [Saccharomycodes ludwigii]